jgi:hypothetical protein
MDIPQGNRKEDFECRKNIISQVYRKWTNENPDKRIYNHSLKGNVNIRFLSITETTRHAAKTQASTRAILHLETILSEAVVYGKPKPPKKGVKNQKSFSKMIELHYDLIDVGTVKMMVGVKPSGEMIQYCITVERT